MELLVRRLERRNDSALTREADQMLEQRVGVIVGWFGGVGHAYRMPRRRGRRGSYARNSTCKTTSVSLPVFRMTVGQRFRTHVTHEARTERAVIDVVADIPVRIQDLRSISGQGNQHEGSRVRVERDPTAHRQAVNASGVSNRGVTSGSRTTS